MWRRFDSGGAEEEMEDFLERSFSFMPIFMFPLEGDGGGRCEDDDDIEVRCVIINIIIRTFAYNITNLDSFYQETCNWNVKGGIFEGYTIRRYH